MTRPKPFEPGALEGLAAPWGLVGVQVWTGRREIASAISFAADGRVLACGSADEVASSMPAGAQLTEGGGCWVCPGFVDPHIHVRAAASASATADVSGAGSPDQLLAAVRHACSSPTRGDHAWVTLSGLQDLSPRRPDRRDLDRVSHGATVRIRDRSGHGWLFNTAGLAALGISEEDRDAPTGVVVERDAAQVPTGFVADHVGWVGRRLGRLTGEAAMTESVGAWSADLARAGVVALCDVTATNGRDEIASLMRWRADGALKQEITFMTAPGATVDDESRSRLAGVKFAQAEDPRLADELASAEGDNFVAVHCVDPEQTGAAITAARDAGADAGRRLRIEHAAFVPDQWVSEISELGATVVTHPSFVEAHGDRYLADPDLDPSDWVYRLGSWDRAGVPLAFASDAPFGPPAPLSALKAAAARQTSGGRPLTPSESLAGEPALRALTTRAADCSGLGRLGYGRLAEGGPAAAVVLTEDPRDPEKHDELELVATIIGGEVVA